MSLQRREVHREKRLLTCTQLPRAHTATWLRCPTVPSVVPHACRSHPLPCHQTETDSFVGLCLAARTTRESPLTGGHAHSGGLGLACRSTLCLLSNPMPGRMPTGDYLKVRERECGHRCLQSLQKVFTFKVSFHEQLGFSLKPFRFKERCAGHP